MLYYKYAKNNLLKDGVKEENIYVTGNTIIDTLPYTVKQFYKHPELDWVGDDKLIFIFLATLSVLIAPS